ncbi:MAG TPA: response regulator transcription factor [Gammaproteobacteria bacterium]|nr:response regulator transcription factor [Gammaproteobacteria bacterium]
MRLLLAEDDDALAAGLKKELIAAGYAVDTADNGVEAEYLGNESIYDVVVLDLGLPRRSGLEVLRNWRSNGNALPVIVLTARNAWHERVEGFKAGADDYLGKPFHAEELLARLTALLHRTSHMPGGTLTVSDLLLDEERQTVTTPDGEAHRLTGTEFRLLRYMLLHPGKVLSKSLLTEHIYNMDSDKDSNVIEVYIRRLRQLLGSDRIKTLRGQGYVFRDS